MQIEVLQAILVLKIAGVAQARLADVDRRYPGIGLAQSMDCSLGCSAAGDQDLPICLLLLGRPEHKRCCPTPIRVPVELAVPIEVVDRRRIRMEHIEGTHLCGWPRGSGCSRLLP